MDNDSLGNRQKQYEMAEAGRTLIPLLPIMIRLDGKGFSRFTKGLKRPYDERLMSLMQETTKSLVEHSGAILGYTQSDEISLIMYQPSFHSQIYFNGRIQKLTSVLSSYCTAVFNSKLASMLPEKANKLALFDCRVWNVPNLLEAANAILWRELDATKNAITMAASCHYSHNQLHKKNGKEKQEMLFQKGINFNDYPSTFKRGTYICRKKKFIKFTTEEISKLPEKHQAKTNPDFLIERNVIEQIEFPPLSKIFNKAGVLFLNEEPIIVP